MMRRLLLALAAIMCLLVPSPSFGEKTNVLYYGSSKPPGKYRVFIHDTYEYYVYQGVLVDSSVQLIVDAVNHAFNVWGNPVTPKFMGVTNCPPTYGDGINVIGISTIADSEGNVDLATKAIAIYDVEASRFIDEADIALSSFSGWHELEYYVSIDDVPEINCSLRNVMAHEVGHILGYNFHNHKPGTLMYYSGACAGDVERPLMRELLKMHRAYRWRDKMIKRDKVVIALEDRE